MSSRLNRACSRAGWVRVHVFRRMTTMMSLPCRPIGPETRLEGPACGEAGAWGDAARRRGWSGRAQGSTLAERRAPLLLRAGDASRDALQVWTARPAQPGASGMLPAQPEVSTKVRWRAFRAGLDSDEQPAGDGVPPYSCGGDVPAHLPTTIPGRVPARSPRRAPPGLRWRCGPPRQRKPEESVHRASASRRGSASPGYPRVPLRRATAASYSATICAMVSATGTISSSEPMICPAGMATTSGS